MPGLDDIVEIAQGLYTKQQVKEMELEAHLLSVDSRSKYKAGGAAPTVTYCTLVVPWKYPSTTLVLP